MKLNTTIVLATMAACVSGAAIPQGQGHPLEPKSAQGQGHPLEPKPGHPLEPKSAQGQGHPLEPKSAQGQGHPLEPKSAQGQGHPLEPKSAQGQGHPLEPKSAQGQGHPLEPKSAQGQGHPLEPKSAQGQGHPLEPKVQAADIETRQKGDLGFIGVELPIQHPSDDPEKRSEGDDGAAIDAIFRIVDDPSHTWEPIPRASGTAFTFAN